MLGHTVGTKMDLMNLAMDDRQVAVANIATAANRRADCFDSPDALPRPPGAASPAISEKSGGRDHGAK